MQSPCPKCKKLTSCGCKSCRSRGETENMTTFDKTGELIICPFCHKASTPDSWLDAEYKYIQLCLVTQTQKTTKTEKQMS